MENSSRTGGCFEWNTTQKEDGKSGSYNMTTNEKTRVKKRCTIVEKTLGLQPLSDDGKHVNTFSVC